MSIAGEHLRGEQMAAAFGSALGEEVTLNAVTPEAHRGLGFPGAEDIGDMFQFTPEFEAEHCGVRDIDASRRLNPQLKSFEEWLAANRQSIPVG